jgi:rhamnosyl/mannosyltransferase
MKILHVYKDYYPVVGGIENHLRGLAEAQAARGHDVTVLVTSRDRHGHVEQVGGVRVIFAARLASVASTPLSAALFTALGRERPDIAHLHVPYPVGELAQSLAGHARRTVLTYHSDVVRQRTLLRFYAPLLRRTLARADAILATSPRYVETSPFLAPIAARCTVVPFGIDVPRFQSPDPARVAALRAEYGQRLILFTGHLRYYKGVDTLIQAMPAVAGRVLLAGGEGGPRQAALEARARALGAAERVTFLGRQTESELIDLYHACDVFTLPCVERSEAFGVVQLEAMAAGKPVVSADVGTGVAWVNQDGVTGLVVQPRDVGQLSAALNRLLDDADLRTRLGAAARARVEAEFRHEQMLDRIEGLYNKILP